MSDVFDNFNRPNDPSSLGTATSGQVWSLVPGETHVLPGSPFGIVGGTAFCNGGIPGELGDSLAVVETGMVSTRGEVTLPNISVGTIENLRNAGLLFHYVDASHYVFLTYSKAFSGLFRLYVADGGVPIARGPDCSVVMADGDTMGYAVCGQTITAYHNGEVAQNYPITFTLADGFVMSPTLLAGTMCGLQCGDASKLLEFENFSIVNNGECVTYDCSEAGCVFNADGLGEFNSLAACEASCGVTPSYNYLNGVCCDPGNGLGEFATLAECQASDCGVVPPPTPPTLGTFRFDEGEGSNYYLVPPVIDSTNELRSKVIKSMRSTGRRTNVSMKAYGYDVNDEINVEDLEDGLNASTRAQSLPDATDIDQSPRKQINVKNAVLSTVRLQGDDTGQTERDEIHQIVVDQADEGVRR